MMRRALVWTVVLMLITAVVACSSREKSEVATETPPPAGAAVQAEAPGDAAAAITQAPPPTAYHYPPTKQIPVEDDYHGTIIVDPYRWLENADDPEVVAWTETEETFTHGIIDTLPQKTWLISRFDVLWRYDDESVPIRVLAGDRLFYWTKNKEDEKWAFVTREREGAEPQVVLDPNHWDPADQLAGVRASRAGRFVAYGTAHGGDENPIVQVLDLNTGDILPDRLRGWKQSVGSWLPDDSGFYYTCKPLAAEVPEGEHEYWHSAWLHKLGTPTEQDVKVFSHDEVKEYWHSVSVTEDGAYTVYYRGLFNANDLWYQRTGSTAKPTPLAVGMTDEYGVDIIDGKILITTNAGATRKMVYITDVDQPGREQWRVFIPEDPQDKLEYIAAINGLIYASYSHNAYTQIKIYDLTGNYLRDLPLPTIGTASVSGRWSQPEVWVRFSSFSYPTTTFKYHPERDELEVYREFPVEVDVDDVVAEQVWYESCDGTPVSMFIVHREGLQHDGSNPTLLGGYGGFDVSMRPRFSTSALVWLEAGGVYAIPNLRGGGEYGREWHEAGMLGNKQNVFDDFIAAAEYLIAQGYTSDEKLAIRGGSNGGLLVGAATVQRPDLFRVVNCGVPLLDMVNYHEFGLANIWAEEYGSSEDPEQFEYLYKYSPYHNVKEGVRYPAFIVTGSENDARVDPLHARKMTARLQAADIGGGPICLLVRKASGHGGGTTITTRIAQVAEERAFLMYFLGMEAP